MSHYSPHTFSLWQKYVSVRLSLVQTKRCQMALERCDLAPSRSYSDGRLHRAGRGDEVQSTGQQSFPTRQRMIERRELPVTYIGRKPFLSITAFRECLKKRELKAVTERRRTHR